MLKALIPADNEGKYFVLYENNLPKDLKSKKGQLQASQPSHDSPFSYFVVNYTAVS